MIWACPICHSRLEMSAKEAACPACRVPYPVRLGIIDFRKNEPNWLCIEDDYARALAVEETVASRGLEAALYDIFRVSQQCDHERAVFRVSQVFAGVDKCGSQLDGWLHPALDESPVIEIGCGPGQLLAAGARRGKNFAGIDASLEWLVIAKHLVGVHGGEPRLAAAFAESLPLASQSTGAIISLDVIEHIENQQLFVAEIARALHTGGWFALSTPNRFSLSPEPHVGVWGVGYLPTPLQAAWVKLVAHQSYENIRLLSTKEAKRLFGKVRRLEPTLDFPPIAEEEIAIFPSTKAKLARCYNRLIDAGWIRPFLAYFGAYYRITGVAVSSL